MTAAKPNDNRFPNDKRIAALYSSTQLSQEGVALELGLSRELVRNALRRTKTPKRTISQSLKGKKQKRPTARARHD